MSEYFKDVLAIVVGTALATLMWVGIGGGTYRPLSDTDGGSRTVGSQPAPATGVVTVGQER